ncbi:hypothetical protein HUN39_17735 [Methylocystis sp. FS]|uniref:hypothetical protein n=1 Tax=Methylocystis silviterrae TaxID=2743612 RepID=UPI001583F1B0|nr:hypothetical protein [Methylocystis silviterrae]NUJ81830.1 hypothetical protein [Methylocystis silviterrae]
MKFLTSRVIRLRPGAEFKPHEFDRETIAIYMFFPDDAEKRDQHYRSILPGPTAGKYELAEATKHTIIMHGMVVGRVLCGAIESAIDRKKVSQNKLIEGAIAQVGRKNSFHSDALRLDVGYFQRGVWPKFKNVAHLWGAFFKFFPEDDPGDNWEIPCAANHLPEFLNFAEALRVAGEKHTWPRSSATFIDPESVFCFEPGRFNPEPIQLRPRAVQ